MSILNLEHWLSAGLSFSLLSLFSPIAQAESTVDFNRDIRPVLSDNCFNCHGPDEKQRKAHLRLDTKAGAFAELDGRFAIVPGSPDKNELVYRIVTDDEDDHMPPSDSGKSLTPEEIDLIQRWIVQGADWQEHWAFIKIEKPIVPKANLQANTINPIDAFIYDHLEKRRLLPSDSADKSTLIRRVTFDLTGLPPTPGEIHAFIEDNTETAYDRVVDRLFASPRYGEHLAHFWLDAARYGDTHGLHLDNYREMWPYRDWVVRAFNDNKAYDQFLTEQIAGDLLPEPTEDQLIATGFNRCHVTTAEGGSITEEVYVRNVVDRVVTFGTVTMGLTLDCTRCHNHKFDPFTQEDFYSLFAFFNNLDGSPLDGNAKRHRPLLRMPTEEQNLGLAKLNDEFDQLNNKFAAPWPEVDQEEADWLLKVAKGVREKDKRPERPSLKEWHEMGPFSVQDADALNFLVGPEGNPAILNGSVTEGLTDQEWKRVQKYRDGAVHELPTIDDTISATFLYREVHSKVAQQITASLGSGDAIKAYLNGRMIFARDVRREAAANQEQLDLSLREGKNHLVLKVVNYAGKSGFYFDFPSVLKGIPKDILEIVRKESNQRDEKELDKLREHFREKVSQFEELVQLKKVREEKRKQRDQLEDQVVTTLIWREKEEVRKAYLLKRGEYDQRGNEVARKTPAALPRMTENMPNDRLGLTRWLLAPAHPLTARVAVNRFWQQFFGTGLVKTAEDFGSQGEPPSHPRLLDWLAAQFRDEGWDMKKTQKRIVMSSTYRQSSHVTPELWERDPDNRLLARGPRFRLDAEMLRDQALFVSGTLVEKMGGPSVKPPQPDGLWHSVGYSGSNTARFVADKGPDKVQRRTLYTFIKRTALPPQMGTFDNPSREACTVRRERTNTPLQALLLCNDPQYIEAARRLAERTLREGGESDAARAAFMFHWCTGRQPTTQEITELVQAYEQDLAHYQKHKQAAENLVAIGENPSPENYGTPELAAWTLTANLLLNLDEVIMKN